MKSLVACLLVLATFATGLGQRQNPRRSQNNTAPATPTIRICQGVPIPDGYVIVGYLTSAACPHGSYVLKKVNSYESSLGVNRNSSDAKTSSVTASDPDNKPRPARPSTDKGTRSSVKRSTSPAPSNNSTQLSTSSPAPGGSAASASRPRVVGTRKTDNQTAKALVSTSQSQDEEIGPPTLSGADPVRPTGPPTLAKAGSQPQTSNTTEVNDPAAEPTAEELSEGDVLRVDTTLVTVPVSVLDRQGRFIPNLKREDFTLLENGNEQSIAFFETAEKPFTVALVLDTSASTQFKLSEIKAAALEFAKQLRPQDRVLLVTFNSEVLLLTDPTNDLELIAQTIEEFVHSGTATRLYDAVNLTIAERLNRIKGRKAIVLFTDGVDTASQQASYQSTLEQVEELDALIYPVQYDTSDYMRAMQGSGQGTVTTTTTRRGIFGSSSSTQTYSAPANNGAPLPGTTKEDYDRANLYLHALADKSGGRLYQANDTRQLADSFSRIAEELRRQYTLGYYPKTASVADGERRAIRVRVRQPNLAVKARNSYVRSSPSQNK
ncbi:MAG TPA: VWA domain-containing protein [Pyrinomonadaceae bacterium]|nr:VWA domain-containing protein [Pyrinomonadaceae bacterium]